MAKDAEPARASPGGCECSPDPFADLPPELRPATKPAMGQLRQATCPRCGLRYSTNRSTDLCVDCQKKDVKVNHTDNRRKLMLTIKVLGPGCRNCDTLAKKAGSALEAIVAENPDAAGATIEKVTDHNRFVDYGLMFTPGLVVNEKLVSSGRIPAESEIKGWITEALA
jgi:small redox-active disulfide protein 2